MQSIYRFRKSDVGLFLKVRDRGIGGIKPIERSLYRNNRSTKELVEWVNSTFVNVFSHEDDLKKGAVKFSPAAYTKETDLPTGVHVHSVIDRASNGVEGEEGSPASKQEAQKVVQLIRQAQLDDPQGSIAVLVKARTHLAELVNELRFQGPRIRYQAVEIEPLAGRQAIQDLVSLTRALFHLADRVNWLAILRAPWCGLVLADLHALAADAPKTPIWALLQDERRIGTLSEDGQVRVLHMRRIITDAFKSQGRQRPRRWVEGIWQSIGGPSCIRDEGEYMDVVSFFNLLDKLETRGSIDLVRLEAELEKLFAAPDPLAPNTIQIMTIHKSKGLEFDTVILPGLHRKSPNGDKQLMVWDEVLGEDGQEHLLVAPLSLSSQAEDGPSKSNFLYQFEQERAANETQRLLYVAVTRAKRELHLLGTAKLDKDGEVQAPSKGTCLSLLWTAVSSTFDEAAQQIADVGELQSENSQNTGAAIDESEFEPMLMRVASPACLMPTTDKVCSSDSHAKSGSELMALNDAGRVAADVGTLVHRYLEFIATDGLENWSLSRIEKIFPRMRNWFLGKGYSAKQAVDLAADVLHHLKITIESEDGKWVLRCRDDGGCELALSNVDGTTVRANVIDRTFVENGVRWIVDYKTTGVQLEVTQDELRLIAQSYSEQLERYESLLVSLGLPIKRGVFFTRVGRLISL